MEFVIMLASLVGFAFFVIALEAYRARKREKEFIGELYHNYTKLSDKSYSPAWEAIMRDTSRSVRLMISHGMILDWMRFLSV